MLITIDIGNTNTVVGVFDGDKLISSERFESERANPQETLIRPFAAWLEKQGNSPKQIAIASVVPELSQALGTYIYGVSQRQPLLINAKVKLPLKLDFDDPSQVGADRICNAVAAKELYHNSGEPLVVVDFGTATTFDILSSAGDYIGGIICPGPKTAVATLAKKAALLESVPIEPPSGGVIARNTSDAIKSGMFYGTIGEIEYLLKRIGQELGQTPQAIATGGLGALIAEHCDLFSAVCPDLTLHGIRLIAKFQR
ncbi:type III pantothenate kinase [bacterium AH-315-J21]|nr:type III pantothenate kinase [bacterium AH-315-J21]